MPQGSKLSDFEHGRICELHKQGLSQRVIAAEIHGSKTAIFDFLNDPEGYGKVKSTCRPKKISPILSRRIKGVVSQDREQSSRQITADADCSAIKIWRHL